MKTVLVTGARGKTGSRVSKRLADRGVPVRIGSRAAHPPFDWTQPAGWAACLEGIGAAYLAYQPDLAMPGALEAIDAFVGVAKACGLERLVLLSGRGESSAQRAEALVQESGLDWTVIRAAWFNQNFDEGQLLESVRQGEIALPAGSVAEPFVDADDIAEIAVAALTESGHSRQLYEVTGPRLLTFEEVAGELRRACGREVRYRPITPVELERSWAELGMDPREAAFLSQLFRDVLDGRNAHLSDGVERALGRKARDFSDYVRAAAARGAWAS